MKKILYVTRPMVPPWNEGSKRLVWELATRMEAFEPHLLTDSASAAPFREFTPIHWHPVYRGGQLTLGQKGRLLRFLSFRFPEVDLIHSYFVPSPSTSRVLRMLRRIHQLPIVQTVPALPRGDLQAKAVAACLCGDRVVTYSHATAERLAQAGVASVRHIDVGVNADVYGVAPDHSDLRESWGCTREDVVALFSGEYTRLGAIPRLERILPPLLERHPSLHVVIACRKLIPPDAEVERTFTKSISRMPGKERVHLLGEVTNFPALLHACDLFLFPVADMAGKIETPLTLIEAMQAGLPLVTTDLPPLRRMCGEGTAIFHGPAEDEHVGKSVEQLLVDPEYRRRIGQQGRDYATRRYGIRRMVSTYEALYDELL